jgi:CheY-like chemotaxis protein
MLLKDKRIFMVEDNVGNKAINEMLLQQAGAVTAQNRTGKDVGSLIKAFMPVHAILLDLMLPNGLTGYDVFDQIRTIPELAGIPIIAVTASDLTVELPKLREKGFSGCISKPVRFNSFAKLIAMILEGHLIWGFIWQ